MLILSTLASFGWKTLLILFDVSIKAAVMTAAMVFLIKVCHLKNNWLRHYAWLTVLCLMLLLPLLMPYLPSISIPVLPQVIASHNELAWPRHSQSSVITQPNTIIQSPVSSNPESRAPIETSVDNGGKQSFFSGLDYLLPILLVIGYWLGVVFMFTRLGLGLIFSHRILSDQQLVMDEEVTNFCRDQLANHLFRCRVSVHTCPRILVPITVGWLRPKILLPAGWRDWPVAKVKAVLMHELTHIRHYDYLFNRLAAINQCVYWFHPVAWLLPRKLAELAEQASDDAAILLTGSQVKYAEYLLEVAAALVDQPTRTLIGPAMAKSNELGRRIEAILDTNRKSARNLSIAGRVTALLFMVATLTLMAIPHLTNLPVEAAILKAENNTTALKPLPLLAASHAEFKEHNLAQEARRPSTNTRESLKPTYKPSSDANRQQMGTDQKSHLAEGETNVAPENSSLPSNPSITTSGPSVPNELNKDESFTNRTGIFEVEFNPGSSAKTTELNVSVKLESGRMRWVMIDPNGVVRLTGHGSGGNVGTGSGNLRSLNGTWKLRIELMDATATCHIHWVAH